MIPSDIASALDRYEPQMGRLVAKLELMQSRGQWNAGLTSYLCRLADKIAARKPPLNEGREDIDMVIHDMEDIVCDLLREQSDKA